ncbi:MAG TPA: chemotaxis protein CheW [Pyrinomonadaceae bacterium]|jgi:chemotaxis signal transduction protein|nr:chemotaxis protein CheW [Pyrinomonadaceae bacterium]
MKELEDTGAESRTTRDAARETRGLFVLTAGGQTFAVNAEETEGVAEGLTPAPLPHAPASVLGVVSVRGRMRTLLYPPALLSQTNEREDVTTAVPRFVVALRGDEQLALAADSVEGVVTFNTDAFSLSDSHEHPLAATLEQEGRSVQLLDASRLFDAAVRGTERRRPRA